MDSKQTFFVDGDKGLGPVVDESGLSGESRVGLELWFIGDDTGGGIIVSELGLDTVELILDELDKDS